MAGEPGEDRGTGWAGLLAALVQGPLRHLPEMNEDSARRLWEEALELFEEVLGQYGIGPGAAAEPGNPPRLPRSDPRFADPAWRKSPLFALLHQAYLMLGEQLEGVVSDLEGIEPRRKGQLDFAMRALIDALSPANFPLTNPVALDRAAATGGQSLVKGIELLLGDMKRGQLTHSDPSAFAIGENLATTPGKVIHQTRLFQLIQYVPVTGRVLKTPLVIFPAWINRYYILDLSERKSFVRWALEQGISVFMVSWKSADESMGDVAWDDYIAAQIEAVEHVCKRLNAASAHVLGYCVAGTTLAATLAILARRGDASMVKSATFLTAQVDFSEPGDLGHFADDAMIDTVSRLGERGAIDGRYLAATFNLLRGRDLIWSHVERSYLLGQDRPAFDLLHWNGDTTNLPVTWLSDYLRDLYRDNLLVEPGALSACGVPIDLGAITTPSFVHGAREDHIAPPGSVWKLMDHLSGPRQFLLAGSGHIAGVVNPPQANKYQYWLDDGSARTFDEFIAAAAQHKGSWWPCWAEWLKAHDRREVAARGKRKPGGRGESTIEDAPGSYVRLR